MRCAAAATDQHREAIEHDEAEDDRIEPWARDDPDALLPRKRLPADAAPRAQPLTSKQTSKQAHSSSTHLLLTHLSTL